ncbi:MAG: PEP-CTERM sorting domain-containing protein [Pirellulales bacterium]|nr:PEP-CTERM sorting domain-containing protein [Pirellulales bacterium]
MRTISCAVFIAVAIGLSSPCAVAGPYSDAVLADGPVAYYRLDESTGTVAANSSTAGNTLDGTYFNFSLTVPPSTMGEPGPRPGDPSGAATIDGFELDNFAIQSSPNSDAQVVVPDNDLLDLTGALTLEAWVYRDSQTNANQNEGIVGKYVGNSYGVSENNRSYLLFYDPRGTTPGVGFYVGTDGSAATLTLLDTNTDIPLGVDGGWTHLAAVYEPNVRMSVYMNGVSIGEKTTGLPVVDLYNGTAPLWIGRNWRNDVTNTSFEGRIDEVAVYDTALSPEQILAHYLAAVEITAIPGDFNGDNAVNAADYVQWRKHLGAVDESGISFNGDGGGVTESDYLLWRSQFGAVPGLGSSMSQSSAIPEPSALVLLGLASIGILRFLRNRRLAMCSST